MLDIKDIKDIKDINDNSENKNKSKNEIVKDSINNYIFPAYKEEQIKEAFDVFDFNGNNFISVNELKEIFHYINEEVTEEELDEMINLADKEGDGQVNWVNFYEFVSGKTVNEEIKDMKKTPGLYPEDNYNKMQHLKKTKIDFIIPNKEINHINNIKKVEKEENQSYDDDNNFNNNDDDDYINNISNEKKKENNNKLKRIFSEEEFNDDFNNNDDNDNEDNKNEEEYKVDNYVQEILKKRQERLENNFLINKAKIKDIEELPKPKPKKFILKDETQKNKIKTYNNSLSDESFSDKNNNNNNSLNSSNNFENDARITKTSNFLPLDRTNSIKKIKPILNEIIDEEKNNKDNKNINNNEIIIKKIKKKKNGKKDEKNKKIHEKNGKIEKIEKSEESDLEMEKRDKFDENSDNNYSLKHKKKLNLKNVIFSQKDSNDIRNILSSQNEDNESEKNDNINDSIDDNDNDNENNKSDSNDDNKNNIVIKSIKKKNIKKLVIKNEEKKKK